MKGKDWIKNIIYLLLISILFLIGVNLISNYFEEVKITFKHNYLFISLVNFILFGGIGFILGLDKLIKELKKEGEIKFNIARLVVLGFPALILSFPYILSIMGTEILAYFEPQISLIFNVVLGNIIATGINKEIGEGYE